MSKSLSLQKRQQWTERLHLQRTSGLSIKQWCQEHNLSTSIFHYWKGILQPAELEQMALERSSFTELSIEKKSPIILEYHALRIYLEHDFDENALKRCLRVLKERPC